MNLARMFANAFVRRIAYAVAALVLGALASLFTAGQARAQACVPSPLSSTLSVNMIEQHASRGAAIARCEAIGRAFPNIDQSNSYGVFAGCVLGPGLNHYKLKYDLHYKANCAARNDSTQYGIHSWAATCPDGGEWRDDLKRCFDETECTSRNGAANGFPDTPQPKPFESLCLDGCTYKMDPNGGQCTKVAGGAPDAKICFGSFQFSGQSCALPPDVGQPDPNDGKEAGGEVCKPTGDGLKMCVDPSGKECLSTPKGAMVCWGVGEVGSKVTGNEQQTRGPGTTEPTPPPPTPPETFDPAQKGPATTTTTTTNNTTTTVTTVTNGTTNGTKPPGTPGQGPGGGGDPDADDKPKTATGGGDCDTPPIVTGDAHLAMVATQTWATRCAVKAGNTAKVTGDVADCKAAFTVEGDNANAEQLRALRKTYCGAEGKVETDVSTMKGFASDLDSEIAGMEGEHTSIFAEGTGIGALSLGRYGGGGGCPDMSVTIPGVGAWAPPPQFCDIVAALRLLFLAVATIWALQIVRGD